jgi:tetratricopeptide (TPR) repeat protein
MMWSSKFEDSEWCKKEFNTLETKENSRSGFRYVIAKLDNSALPGFASGKIYVDFAEHRAGPSGTGLLRLLYGLTGDPLPPAAVQLAAQVDEETTDALNTIRSARAVASTATLMELAARQSLAWLSSPMLGCEVADALIALGEYDEALTVLEQLQRQFPKALRPQQLVGLALARSGQWEKAQILLGKLYAAGEIDPETLGIYARTWMDRYKATKQRLFLLKSRDLYRQAFEAAPSDYYTGINAASKSLLLGERDTAKQLASRVEKIVGSTAVPNDYWKTATVAEVQLLQGLYPRAAALYEAAVSCAPLEISNHESTYGQACLLLDCLEAQASDRESIHKVFSHLEAARGATT